MSELSDLKEELNIGAEHLISLYLVVFIVLNFSGFVFLSDPVWAPYLETSSTSAPEGSLWIEGDNLIWSDGGTEYRILADGTDSETGSFSTSGPIGSAWISGTRIYYIDEGGDGRWAEGEYVTSSHGGVSGDAWIDTDGLLHYIDEDGDQRRMEDTTP